MRKDISFAGIAMKWSDDYARDYCDKLIEMGFYAKVMNGKIVAYSPLPFSRADAGEVFVHFIEGIDQKKNE